MSVKYDKLFALLKEKSISKTELASRVGFSSRTLAKFSNGEYVNLKILEKICNVLECTPSDIVTFNKEMCKSEILNILKEEKEMQLKGGLYHLTQIKLTYNSNHIEGSRLSEDQTRYIYETNTIGVESSEAVGVDDVIETMNHFRCIDYCIDIADVELSESIIKKLHEFLKSGTSDSRKEWFAVGDYKKKSNFVGDSTTTAPSKVSAEITKLLLSYNKIKNKTLEDIVAFHHDFELIHPFQDGNGRVGRLITFKECLKLNITPFIIDEEIKMFYYRGLKEWNGERGYLIETCKLGQDKYSAIVDYFTKD